MRFQPLTDGLWTEEASRRNLATVSAFVVPGNPATSRLLQHPLAREHGGDAFHGGGKHWSRTDATYQTLAAWVRGETTPPAKTVVRIVQTNSAGDDSHVIDPETNQVVAIIQDIGVPHGVTSAPDGSRVYVTDEALHTLDVVDALEHSFTLRVGERRLRPRLRDSRRGSLQHVSRKRFHECLLQPVRALDQSLRVPVSRDFDP